MIKKPKSEEIECRLTDAYGVMRYRFAQRTDFTPTKAQFDRGLSDVSFFVREAFVQRNDFRPTPEELNAMLNDRHFQVREAAQRKQVQMEMEALKERHSEVLLALTNVAAL